MTRRFDRLSDGTKVHTQTLCALDQLDFNLADTHSYAQYLDVIDRLGLGPNAREQGFRRLVFNVAGANRDDHTKNLSFCCDTTGSGPSLRPMTSITRTTRKAGGPSGTRCR
jgi:serine/threonine-protein kinase HipA